MPALFVSLRIFSVVIDVVWKWFVCILPRLSYFINQHFLVFEASLRVHWYAHFWIACFFNHSSVKEACRIVFAICLMMWVFKNISWSGFCETWWSPIINGDYCYPRLLKKVVRIWSFSRVHYAINSLKYVCMGRASKGAGSGEGGGGERKRSGVILVELHDSEITIFSIFLLISSILLSLSFRKAVRRNFFPECS